ncbi:MAG: hypothetical protein J1E97_05335 [Muribaculaceae bacterium]|nr:hypothetical protein [Muribaculaceae bacterium]
MKKTLLIAAAMIAASSSAFAEDYYVIGNDVNGQSWVESQADAKFTQTSTPGVYEWSGQTLGNGFKINNGNWTTGVDWGAGSKITRGETYQLAISGASDIKFNGFGTVTNPKITLNVNDHTIVLTGEAEDIDPSLVSYYMCGSNVNGQSWALEQADAKFTDEGNGLYRWKGEVLGSGFKINDGTWGYELGGNGSSILMNQPYNLLEAGGSNISFEDGPTLFNPEVELNMNDKTLTLVGGTFEGDFEWFISGLNGVTAEFEPTDEAYSETLLSPVEGAEGLFAREVYIMETTGKFKISDNGWSHQFGTNRPEEVMITPEVLEASLEPVDGEGGDIEYELEEGSYLVTFDYDQLTVKFESLGDDAVETVVVGNEGVVEYYNLHGVRVQNPDKGVYVRVLNGKAEKVVL